MSKSVFYAFATAAKAPTTLDAVNERLLTTLAAKWHAKTPVTVLEAMVILPEISTTTAHRRLKQLRNLGWIDLRTDDKDNRIKYIEPQKLASKHFAALGAAMVKAVSDMRAVGV